MPRQATVYRILIASPSDVVDERGAISEVIRSWNAANSLSYGVILEPVSWETHAIPEMGDRPQAIINKLRAAESNSCESILNFLLSHLITLLHSRSAYC